MNQPTTCVIGFLLATLPLLNPAIAEETGRAIAERAQAVLFGYISLEANGDMTIARENRETGQRRFRLVLLENGDDTRDYGLITVESPVALRDTKLLSWSDATGDERQWLFTPRSRKARRIADRGRKASFINSTYAFEDMLKWQLDNYTYDAIGEIECPAGTCQRVIATPTSSSSSYGELIVDYDEEYRISRIVYHRPDSNEPWKEQIVHEYTHVGDSWQPAVSEMTDLETRMTTEILWSDYKADTSVSSATFSPNAL